MAAAAAAAAVAAQNKTIGKQNWLALYCHVKAKLDSVNLLYRSGGSGRVGLTVAAAQNK